MLILGRKSGESIKIGDNITLEIISVTGNTVKVGIEAPKEIGILRKELYDMIKNENINASNVLDLADLSELNSLNSLNSLNDIFALKGEVKKEELKEKKTEK